MTAPALGGRRATRGTTRAHVIAVSPHLRPDGTRHPNAFEARLAGAPLCVSETPLLDAARALLARDIAQPDDTIVMRHVGSHVDALRARVGVAARLAVEDRPSGNPGLRLGKWRKRVTAPPSIARRPSRLPGQPPADKSHPTAHRAGAAPRLLQAGRARPHVVSGGLPNASGDARHRGRR